MTELTFSLDDIKDFIEKEIPDAEKPELLKLLSAPDSDETSLDAIGAKYFEAAFIQSDETIQGIRGGMSFKEGISTSIADWKKAMSDMKAKIRWLLCTEGHQEHFDKAEDLIKALVPIFTASLGKPTQTAIAAATAFAIHIARTGIQNWCSQCNLPKP